MLFWMFPITRNKKGSENEAAHCSTSERFSWKDCPVLTGKGERGGGPTRRPSRWGERSAPVRTAVQQPGDRSRVSRQHVSHCAHPLSPVCRASSHSRRSSQCHQAGEVHADRKLTLCHCHHQLRGQQLLRHLWGRDVYYCKATGHIPGRSRADSGDCRR